MSVAIGLSPFQTTDFLFSLCLIVILHPHNLRMLLKLSKHLLPQWVGNLGVDAGVPDVAMSQVIGNVLDASSGFEEVYGDGVITTGRKMYQNQRFENVPGSVLGTLQTGRY
jgi:hypothetical protein